MTTPAIDLAPVAPTAADPPAARAVEGTPGRRTAITWLTRVASVAISVAALAILLRRVDLPAALRSAANEPRLELTAALALNVVATWLRAMRSRSILTALGEHVSAPRNAGIQLAGQTLSWVSPAAAGDFVRPYLWRSHDGVALTPGVVTVLYERIVSFGQLALIGAVCVAPFALAGPALAVAVVAGTALLALPWALARALPAPTRDPAGPRPRGWRGRLTGAAADLWRLSARPRLTTWFTTLTIAIAAVCALQVQLLAAGIGVALPLWVAAAAFALPQVIGSASSLPFGLGPADAVLVALLVHVGAGPAGALAITLLSRLTVTLPLGLAGAGSYLWLSRRTPGVRAAG